MLHTILPSVLYSKTLGVVYIMSYGMDGWEGSICIYVTYLLQHYDPGKISVTILDQALAVHSFPVFAHFLFLSQDIVVPLGSVRS